MTETHKLLLSFILTLGGSGLGTGIVAALLKWRFDGEVERLRAALERGSRIHERQVNALLTIHSKLEGAAFYLWRAASPGRLNGEETGTLVSRAGQDLAAASAEYSQNKLLLSQSLIAKLDGFFDEAVSLGVVLNLVMDPMTPDGSVRAKFWDQAREKASKELPAILAALRAEARLVIHGTNN